MSQTHARRVAPAARSGRAVPTGDTPWSRADVVQAAVLAGLGCVVWVVGWYRVADEPDFSAQVGPMNVAIAGFVIVCVGQMVWFLGGRRAVSDRRRNLLGSDTSPAVADVSTEQNVDSFTGSERFYHRLDCSMADERGWAPASRAAHEQAGRAACGLCAP